MPYTCACGREFSTITSFAGHCSHCKIHLGRDPIDRFGESRAWSKGKTKDTDIRVALAAKKQREAYANGTLESKFLGKHHSEKTKRLLSQKAKLIVKEGRNGWKSGDSHKQNQYEKFTHDFLDAHGIQFKEEVTIPKSVFGKTGSYYQFDFLVNEQIDLEIDGTSHCNPAVARHDLERDEAVSTRYVVYRIVHHDNLEKLETGLNKFLEELTKGDLVLGSSPVTRTI